MRNMEERYRNDATFHALVDMLMHGIRSGQFTPSETREAAMFAQLKYELESPRPIVLSRDLKEQLRAIQDAEKRER